MINSRLDGNPSSPALAPAKVRRAEPAGVAMVRTPESSGVPGGDPFQTSSVSAGGGAATRVPRGNSDTATAPVAPAAEAPLATLVAALGTFFKGLMAWVQRLFSSVSPAPATPPTPGSPANPVPTPAPTASGSLVQAIAATAAGQPLSLGAAAFSVNNFGSNPARMKGTQNDQIGIELPATIGGGAGAGVDRTVIRMTPQTSTHAKNIPTIPMTTNQYSLMRIMGSPNLHDFTLQGTDQGHLYNGLRLHTTAKARVTNVKVTGIPGNDGAPPGETFGINDFRTTGSIYKNVEVDGQGVGASGFGANSSTNVTIDHGYFHGNPHGIGATFWQTRNVTIIDTTTTNNSRGFNFERVSGNVEIIRPRISNISGKHDIAIGTDQESAKYTIIDPVLDPGQKLRIMVRRSYLGLPCPQKKSDIRVIVNGVDRTQELVVWG